jgi:hypothetical protein
MVFAQLRHGDTLTTRRYLIDSQSGEQTRVRGPGWIGTGFEGAWSPDDERLAVKADESVYVVDTATGRVLSQRRGNTDGRLQYTDDGTRLFTGVEGGYAFLDAQTLETLSKTVIEDVGNANDAMLGPTESSIVVLTADEPRSAFDFTQLSGWTLVDLGTGEVQNSGTFGI